ncbi:MAG: PucR family transcriptional regulator [Pseudonocardia sp.]
MVGVTVAEVLAELEHRHPGLTEVSAGPSSRPGREVRATWLAEDLRDLDDCPPGALVVLGRVASREARGYRLDVALRRLDDVAGLVLQSEAPTPSLSALALARREDLSMIRLTRPVDVTQLLTTVVRMLDAQLPTLLDRAVDICRAVDALEAAGPADVTGPELLHRSGAARTFGLAVGERDPALAGVPAVLTDPRGPWLQRRPTLAPEDALAHLVTWRLCGALTRRTIEAEQAEQLSLLSAGELLHRLLDAAAEDSGPWLRRAADLGIRVEAWNQVVDLEFTNLLDIAGDDTVIAYHQAQTLSRVARQTAAHHDGTWTMAPRTGGVLLVRTHNHADGPAALRRLRTAVQAVLDRAAESSPGIEILCGVGGSHEGLQGLRASRAEADSALQSARLRGAANEPVMFDAPGLSRLLVEWYSSTSVRQSIDDLLAPLATLGRAKQHDYFTTLRVYLENNRSISRTCEQLYLHRNTVAYRIRRIVDVLGVDLDDPNQFLAVNLACHAAFMAQGSGRARARPD